MSKTPLLPWGQKSPEFTTGSDLSGGKGQQRPAPSHAKKTAGPPLSPEGNPMQGGGEASASQGQQFTADALANLARQLGGAKLAEALAKILPKKPLNNGKKPVPLRSRWRRRWRWRASDPSVVAGRRISRMERLVAAAISSPKPTLPVHTAKNGKKEMIDKRQIMYAVAVMLPMYLLASAAGVHVFAGPGAWVAGAGVFMWIIASAGMVLNQYGKFNWELLVARHLNRLCLLGGALLLSFYAFRAYFPSEIWAFCLLVGIAATVLGVPWVMSTIRADDIITGGDDADMAETAGETI